ncbi:MAG: tRNA 2-thiouridine(34) synthase MnmA [Candidatus Omnitrophota bacterium]|nr:MAG: tRNA 2-thiouridine(34) synthase MnmA [Candidatus Omnitrophota bacterium]
MRKKILVAMSGGVDSSVASLLLKRNNFDVTGVTMCFGNEDEATDVRKPRCCGSRAIEDARRVCHKLDIPHYVMDFSKDLRKHVINKFVSEYSKGRTPNPCIECNRYLKFAILLGKAQAMGFDFLATGHYARIEAKEQNFLLKRAKDKAKDQAYFLYPIKKHSLKCIMFPLGDLTKKEVRKIANDAGLPVARKPESQDICFIREKNYHMFLLERIKGTAPGRIVDTKGNFLGKHRGVIFYTIGQRKGLGISSKRPLYVVSTDAKNNKIIVGEEKDLKAKGFMASDVNILVEKLPRTAFAKIRYADKEAKCNISIKGKKLKIMFKKRESAITPGQSVVLYGGDTILGGGIIEGVLRG